MPILVKGDNVRSATKVSTRHKQFRPAQGVNGLKNARNVFLHLKWKWKMNKKKMKIEHVGNIKIAKFEAPRNIFYAGLNFFKKIRRFV